jgi:hypothetical protein
MQKFDLDFVASLCGGSEFLAKKITWADIINENFEFKNMEQINRTSVLELNRNDYPIFANGFGVAKRKYFFLNR